MSEKEIWDAVEDVKDPEIPKVSVVNMGMNMDLRFGILDWGFLN